MLSTVKGWLQKKFEAVHLPRDRAASVTDPRVPTGGQYAVAMRAKDELTCALDANDIILST